MNKYLNHKDSVENVMMIFGYYIFYFYYQLFLIHNLQLIFSLPLFIIISLIHHKFSGEFIHEGSHYHLHKNKIINEYISNYLVGLFFLVSISNYRKKHFKHHEFGKFFNSKDPETGPLKIHSKKEFWKNIFFDLIGFNGLLFLLNYTNQAASSRSSSTNSKFKFDKVFFVILFIQIIFFIMSIIYNFFIFYITYYLTLGTLYHLQLRFRIVCQHIFLNKENKIQFDVTTSRTIKVGILEKLFFTSDLTAYHEIHHRYPQYPFRKCKKMILENPAVADKNIFSTTRSDLIFNYYKSLS